MARVPAIADDGPLAGDPNLTVMEYPDGTYESPVGWRHKSGKVHLYEHRGERAATPPGVPLYRHIRK